MDDQGDEMDPQELKKRKKQEKLLAKRAEAMAAQNQQCKNHLVRELGFSSQSERKLFEHWERMCTEVKCEQMLEDLRYLQQSVGTVVDGKNCWIDRMVTFRDEIGAIHDKCLHRMKSILDYYIRLKNFLTTTMMAQYQEDRTKLLEEFGEEALAKEEYSSSQMEQLEAALASLKKKMAQDERNDHNWRLECNDANISVQLEKCEILRDKKYTELTTLYRQLQATLDEYFRTVLFPERQKSYQRLVQDTQAAEQGIEKRRNQIAVLQMRKTQLDNTLTLARIAGRRKLNTRRNYRKLLELKLHLLKEQERGQAKDHQARLREICHITHQLKKLLREHLLWGEKVAKLARTCAQYETEQDVRYTGRWFKQPCDEATDHYEYLFAKINRIEAINIILREERTVLRGRNEELRTQLQSLCQQYKISEPEKLRLCGVEMADRLTDAHS
ncbi:uncharacterized protein LOC126574650 [Anopheles aquasalis]|uniref:uncharacterized protein LOC126574650 n=1 Tax=Anopheles aquasalis TaxID=42839 RepID=UPI00215A1BC6|nr:uncharacterized protein LOC126574650 [Anopheles aquasalis]